MNGAALGTFILSHEEIERNYESRSRVLRDNITKKIYEIDNEMLMNLKRGRAVLVSLTDEKMWADFLRVVVSANGLEEKIVVKQVKSDDLVKPGMLYIHAKKMDVDWETIYHSFFLTTMENLLTTMKVSTRAFKDPRIKSRIAAVSAAVAFWKRKGGWYVMYPPPFCVRTCFLNENKKIWECNCNSSS